MNDRLAIITGDHPRHRYLVEKFAQIEAEILWIRETREPHLPTPPPNLPAEQNFLFKKHFIERKQVELDFFSSGYESVKLDSSFKVIDIPFGELNSENTLKILQGWKPKNVFSYGCNKLEKFILHSVNANFVNIHGGLSPWYRGTITHFWPTYLLEPQFTGMTVHETTDQIDGGGVYFQSSISMDINDGIHENACRSLQQFCEQFIPLLKLNWDNFEAIKPETPSTSGRIWRNQMWHPSLLIPIYKTFENRVNKFCLETTTIPRSPTLVNRFHDLAKKENPHA
jgi:hypothetical protein